MSLFIILISREAGALFNNTNSCFVDEMIMQVYWHIRACFSGVASLTVNDSMAGRPSEEQPCELDIYHFVVHGLH